jgi:hypothetical protein
VSEQHWQERNAADDRTRERLIATLKGTGQ